MISFHPSQLNRRLAAPASSREGRGGLSRQPRQLAISNNSSSRSSTTTPSTNRVLSSSSLTPRQSNTASSTNNSISSSTNPLQIRINRSSLPSSHTPGHAPSSPVTRSAMSAMKTIAETGTEVSAGNKRLEEVTEDGAKHEVSLA